MPILIDKSSGAVTWGNCLIDSDLTDSDLDVMLRGHQANEVKPPYMPRRFVERQIKLPRLTFPDRLASGTVHFKLSVAKGIDIVIRLPDEKPGWENWRLEDECTLHQMGFVFLESQLGPAHSINCHTPEPSLDRYEYRFAWGRASAYYNPRGAFPSIAIRYSRLTDLEP